MYSVVIGMFYAIYIINSTGKITSYPRKQLAYHKNDEWKLFQDGSFENRAYQNKFVNLYVIEGA